MLALRRILFPTDFSQRAQAALPAAVSLAETHGAELHFLHVANTNGNKSADVPNPFPGEAEARETLESGRGAPGGTRVTRNVTRGRTPGVAILEFARDLDVDLIVMGSHGRRGFQLWNVGSVTEDVLRHAQRPVLVVRTGEDGTENPKTRRILVPIDFSDATRKLLSHAIELSRTMDASLELIHVIEIPTYPDFYVATLGLPENRRAALDRLKRLAGDLASNFPVAVRVKHGRVPNEISEYAAAHGHDLIVMASHGHTGVRRVLLGSATEGVVRRAPCPVLVLKETGKQLLPEAVAVADHFAPWEASQ